MIQLGIITSQQLVQFEQRMASRVLNVMRLLARDIAPSWRNLQPELDMPLAQFQSRLEQVIMRFGMEHSQIGAMFILQESGQKQSPLDYILMGLRYRLREYSAERAKLITGFIREKLFRVLGNNLTIRRGRELVRQILNNRAYAERIARTETHTAIERGTFEAARSLGRRVTKEWVTRGDSRVRPAHQAAHGQTRELDDPFLVNGEALMFPGDPKGSAVNIINCRCSSKYRLET